MDHEQRRRWQVKATVLSDWQALPGEHSATEVWVMRRQGHFAVAIPRTDVKSNEDAGPMIDKATDEQRSNDNNDQFLTSVK